MLFLTDQQGIPLACSEPVAGNHNDLFEIEKTVSKIIGTLIDALIAVEGLFMNVDAGFDSKKLRALCDRLDIFPNIDLNKRNTKDSDQNDYLFDPQLYKERFVVERTNAWLDGFKNLVLRYETNDKHWLGLHYLAFSIILLRKLDNADSKL
jgi:transposase